jgi:hypothetical protein
MPRIALIILLLAAVTPTAGVAGRTSAQQASPLTTGAGVKAAKRYAQRRLGVVAFAVLAEGGGHIRGFRRTAPYRSASVVKAMMLVSVLRRARGRRLTAIERGRLWPMITRSDNAAASAIYGEIGDPGLRRIAHVAHMRRFRPNSTWGLSQITAADQVRFFLHIDELVPSRHRRYARRLLSSIVKGQRWGIAPVAHRRRLEIFFKGGFVPGIRHQVALLERRGDGARVALAVLTRDSPSSRYGEKTIEGIAARVLNRLR